MPLIIETGVGVRGANSYVSTAYVTTYLMTRNRQTENGWLTSSEEAKQGAVIAATEYVDKRFGHRFIGIPAHVLEETNASAEISFSGVPDPLDELRLGGDVYEFVSSLSGAPYEVLIGVDAVTTATNLAAALAGGAGAGITYGLRTPQSRHSGVARTGAVLTLTAKAAGAGGALTVLAGPVTNVSIVPFHGGLEGGLQPLCWPRNYAYGNGVALEGVPERIRQTVSEYAVRALSAPLMSDPSPDQIGVISKTEIVGPITESFRFSSASIASYPAADRMLIPLLLGSGQGRVIRG